MRRRSFYGLYAQADPGLFATSCLHPASCLYAAILFSGDTCVDNCERELYRGDDAFRTAFALRLAYEYLAPINSYRKFVDSVHEYASSRPNDWVETFALSNVLQMVCERYNKQRVYLMVDDLTASISGLGDSTYRNGTVIAFAEASLTRFTLNIYSRYRCVQTQTEESPQQPNGAVRFSAQDTLEFEAERAEVGRSGTTIFLPLLPVPEIAGPFFTARVTAAQSSTCFQHLIGIPTEDGCKVRGYSPPATIGNCLQPEDPGSTLCNWAALVHVCIRNCPGPTLLRGCSLLRTSSGSSRPPTLLRWDARKWMSGSFKEFSLPKAPTSMSCR
jgi:hypothetical protein